MHTREADILQIAVTTVQNLNASKNFKLSYAGALIHDGHMCALHPSIQPHVAIDSIHMALEFADFGEYRVTLNTQQILGSSYERGS